MCRCSFIVFLTFGAFVASIQVVLGQFVGVCRRQVPGILLINGAALAFFAVWIVNFKFDTLPYGQAFNLECNSSNTTHLALLSSFCCCV
jgi:hypothetical protein